MSMVEDRTQKKRWIIKQRDLSVYNKVRFVVTLPFLPILLLCVVVYALGTASRWFADLVQDYVVRWLAVWIMAILLNKRKEYPPV